jgi:sugar (pentulose or hexulose) kinase
MHVLGIDVGTTGTKALLLGPNGTIDGQGYQGYQLYCDGSRIEQNTEDWWKACITAVRQALPSADHLDVKAISLSAQGASMAALDHKGNPIGRALTWMDTRAGTEAHRLEELLSAEYIYRKTGWRISPSGDAPKILYMKKKKEFTAAWKYLSTADYINFKLTGRAVIDITNAAIRLLPDIETQRWDGKILDAVGTKEMELPEIMKTGEYIGCLTSEAALELGLTEQVKVYNGAHDQYCASLGSGAVNAGDMLISTGTAWVIMAVSEKACFSDTFISPCPHPSPGLYGNMISLSAVGNSYQWIRDKFIPQSDYAGIDEKVSAIRNKDKNLFFIPWLSGAGYPVWEDRARGGFIGMDFDTGPFDMALAIMESGAFLVKNALEDFEQNGVSAGKINIMGGAVKSSVWLELLTVIIGRPVYKMNVTDSCALGAAFIAACGEGWFANYGEAAKTLKSEKVEGNYKHRKFYEMKYRSYKRLLKHLEQIW